MWTPLRQQELPVFVAALTTMLLVNSQETQAQNSSDRPIVLGLGPDACGQQCDFIYNPVCGSDGITYPNFCFLSRASCTDPSITPLRYGSCSNPDPCNFVCDRMYNPVCGSDGRTYSNPCVLMYITCDTKAFLFRRHFGQCVEEGKCPTTCPRTKNPVCGSDGRTYANPCSLRLLRCAGQDVTQVKTGSCIASRFGNGRRQGTKTSRKGYGAGRGRTVASRFGKGRRQRTKTSRKGYGTGKTVRCPLTCTREYLPVCGSDGVTYPSLCVLESQLCQGKVVTAAYSGVCNDNVTRRPAAAPGLPSSFTPRPPAPPACPSTCPGGQYSPVCGSDGRTYGNDCVLRMAACEDRTISKAFNGECGKS